MNTIRPLPTLDDIKRLAAQLGVTFVNNRDSFDLDTSDPTTWELHGTYRSNQGGYNAALSALVHLQENQRYATKQISTIVKRLIVAGSISDGTEAFLLAHGVHITRCLDLKLISLPEDAVVEKQDQPGRYLVAFWTPHEELEQDALLVDLAPNAYETKVTLHIDYWEEEVNS